MTVPDLLSQSAKRWPHHTAIYEEESSWTYADLNESVQQLAEELSSNGIEASMGVGVLGKNSRYFVSMLFAVMKCGAVVMPISSHLKDDEVQTILATAKLHAILDDKSSVQPIAEAIDLEYGWRLSFTGVARNQIFAAHVENPALIRFTSGTTGTSKGVILSHQSILERTEAANKALQLGKGDTVIWVLSMAYHFVVSIILYLRYGCSIVICDGFIADTILEAANRYSGTFLYASPMHIRLLANDTSGRQMPTLKRVISTSTGISAAQCEAFRQRFDIPVSQAYGIIEIGLPIVNMEKSEEKPDAVGYALPDYEVEILDDQFQLVPPETIGHLAMRGPGMFDAYLEPAQKREDILAQGWFMTGDLASKRADGLITLEGRKKSMINVSGNKVFPEEVEAVLQQHPAVQLSRVSGFQHRFLGESVQAEVVLKNGEQVGVEELIGFCRQRLSTYKVPQKVLFVETLPLTGSGKVIRH